MDSPVDTLKIGFQRALHAVSEFHASDPVTKNLARTAVRLLQRGLTATEQATAETAQSDNAVAFRAQMQTVHRTAKAFAHLHTALSIRAAATDDSSQFNPQDMERLRTFLTDFTPSVYQTLDAGDALEVIDIAYQWGSRMLLGTRVDNLLRAVDIVRSAARETLEHGGVDNEAAVVQAGDIRSLESLRRAAYADDVAARNVVMGLLTLEGRAPDLNHVMLSIDKLMHDTDESEYDIDSDVGQTIIG